MFTYFIFLVGGGVDSINGYSTSNLITFFLVFNLFDLFGQIFFRGIYWFRGQVLSGEFDLRLIKPMSPLFQALTRQTDVLDIPMLVVVLSALIWQHLDASINQILLFILLTGSAMVIITSIHILVAALGVMTTEVDHTMMVFRDLTSMARFPIEIYQPLIRWGLTVILPVAAAFTFPAQALSGTITPFWTIMSLIMAVGWWSFSQWVWQRALKHYTSASS
jgi:ABC-2 type transport system permease protein